MADLSEVQTTIRFWRQIMGDAKRTILVQPGLEEKLRAAVLEADLDDIVTIKTSTFVPDNTAYVMDEQALRADMSRTRRTRFI